MKAPKKSRDCLFKKDIPNAMEYYAPIKIGDCKVVRPPKEVLRQGSAKYVKSLVGRFIGSPPAHGIVVSTVNKIWGKGGAVRVSTKGSLFIFQFKGSSTVKWVLEMGPWRVGNRLLLLQEWTPDLPIGDADLSRIPLWIVLKKVPFHLYNHTGLSYIASAIGKPLHMDKSTSSLVHLDFARICVEVNAEDEIEKVVQVDVGEEGDEHIVDIPVTVPWMPEKCKKCRVFGHSCVCEELDMNSDAAASAAAMREAMGRAKAKFSHAKEVSEGESTKAAISRESVKLEKDESWLNAEERALREKQEMLQQERLQREREKEERERRRLQKEREREEKEREQQRLEKERERAREIERERARQSVERADREAQERAAAEARLKAERAALEKANAEARERAERAAVLRAQAEAGERAAAEARERAEKAAAEAREKEARERAAEARAREQQKLEKEREQQRLEKERERAREIERRQAVERARETRERAAAEAQLKAERAAVEKANAEARERAERAAVLRAQAEARERAAAKARERAERETTEAREKEAQERAVEARARAEKAEKAAAEARERAAETRRRAEWADVERAAAEARERVAVEARGRAAASARAKQQCSYNNLKSFFSMGRASSAPRPGANYSVSINGAIVELFCLLCRCFFVQDPAFVLGVESGIEKEREREMARETVERANRAARERAAAEAQLKADRASMEKAHAEAQDCAERAAVLRAQAEGHERAAAEARQRVERAAAEAREKEAKECAAEARRAERAAVERAAAEARERAAAKAQERAAASVRSKQQSGDNDLESFFSMGQASSAPGPRANYSFPSKKGPDVARTPDSTPSMRNKTRDGLSSSFGVNSTSGEFQEVEGGSEKRCRAMLERQQRIQERVAKALAEMNQRDLQAKREQAERHRIAEFLDVEINRWAAGKRGRLRALLSTLQYVLWPDCGWQPVSSTDLNTAAAVKKVYRKATLYIHPDKVQQKGANLQQKYVAEKVFDLIKEAWNKFNSEELF